MRFISLVHLRPLCLLILPGSVGEVGGVGEGEDGGCLVFGCFVGFGLPLKIFLIFCNNRNRLDRNVRERLQIDRLNAEK